MLENTMRKYPNLFTKMIRVFVWFHAKMQTDKRVNLEITTVKITAEAPPINFQPSQKKEETVKIHVSNKRPNWQRDRERECTENNNNSSSTLPNQWKHNLMMRLISIICVSFRQSHAQLKMHYYVCWLMRVFFSLVASFSIGMEHSHYNQEH